MPVRKHGSADIRRDYAILIEIGAIAALVLLIFAFRLDWRSNSDMNIVSPEQERVEMEEIRQTEQMQEPPAPPRPPVPIEVADDEELADQPLDLDATLDFDEPASAIPAAPPPPPHQEEGPEEVEVFVVVEQMPELIGGLAAIQQLIRYPEIAKKAGVEGRVIVQFVVDEHGSVIDPEVVRGIGAGCDEEAIKAVQQARFTPGKQRGKAVRVKMSLPITFRLA